VHIATFEQWAYKYLQFPEKDTLWQTQMAIIYEMSDNKREALERSELALKLDPLNRRASVCRARVAPPHDAIDILQAVIIRQT